MEYSFTHSPPTLSDEFYYEPNGIENDLRKTVGLTTAIKSYAYVYGQSYIMENAKSLNKGERKRLLIYYETSFDVNIKLNMIEGFTKDYRKIIVNAKHELIHLRLRP